MTSRHSSRRHRNRLIAAALAVVLVVGGWWVLRGDSETDTPNKPSAAQPDVTPKEKAKRPKKVKNANFRAPEPGAAVPGLGGLPELPGLNGNTLSANVPPLDLTITLTSSSPIGTIGWVIPTSKDKSNGRADGVGRSFSLSTTVYGRPDWARIFLQAGPTGDPIRCVITVEGKVTESQATVGPYGQMMCQG